MAIAPIAWGLLGTGGITHRLLGGIELTPNAVAVAVGSRTAERADAFAEANGIPRAHGSYEALLADPAVDAIYISLPNALHHEWTMRSLAAGKHVLCEKPYSRRPREVEEAWDAAEAGGVVLAEAFMWRHHPQADALVERLPDLGPLELVRSSFAYVQRDPDDVRLRPDLEGGALLDVGCYCVNGSRLVAGEDPIEVYGVATVGPSGIDTRFTGVLRFGSGVVAEFTAGFTMTTRGLEAIGRDGSVLLTDPWHGAPAVLRHGGDEVRFDDIDPYALELDDMAAAIRGDRPPRLGRADALGQARTLDALLRSAESGQPIRLED